MTSIQTKPAPAPAPAPAPTGNKSLSPHVAQPEPPRVIEPDNEPLDALDDEGLSVADDRSVAASTSLASSIADYVYENNRRYHRFQEGRYLMPNDEPEQERENMKHAMIVSVSEGQLHQAPLKSPQRILDIGTGTGIWAMEMGELYPEAEVIGIDLSPIQSRWVPPNVRFYVDDAEAEWTFDDDSLDYVHARFICMAIHDWPALLRRAYQAVRPGGWVELQELRFHVACDDDTCPDDYGFRRFTEACNRGYRSFGVNPMAMEHNHDLVTEAGFINVTEHIWKVPIGGWARDPSLKMAGRLNAAMILDGLQAVCMAPLTRGLHWTPAEVEMFLVDVRASLRDQSIHSYLNYHTVYGQKPS